MYSSSLPGGALGEGDGEEDGEEDLMEALVYGLFGLEHGAVKELEGWAHRLHSQGYWLESLGMA